jgi:hypothetical protein
MKIASFTGKYHFLSNFHLSDVSYDGVVYPTVEHAYQAAKTVDLEERKKISECRTPGQAKRLGKKLTLRENWDGMKLDVMKELLVKKFKAGPLKEALIDTRHLHLIEGNKWNDTYWGMCNGEGENHLGRLLMEVRADLRYDRLKADQELDELSRKMV